MGYSFTIIHYWKREGPDPDQPAVKKSRAGIMLVVGLYSDLTGMPQRRLSRQRFLPPAIQTAAWSYCLKPTDIS